MYRGLSTNFRRLTQGKFWGWIVGFLVIFGVVLLSLVLTYRSAKADFIPFQARAGRHADYSADGFYGMLEGVGMDVVEAMIEEDLAVGGEVAGEEPVQAEERIATLQGQMQTPIPTATPRPTRTPTATSEGATRPPDAESTATQPPTFTSTYAPITFATYTPANTATAVAIQATQTQAATAGPTATRTVPAINTATLRPGTVPTNTPVFSSTPTNTRVPTSTYTPRPGVTPSSTPTPTNTLVPTNTPRPGNVPPVQQTRTAVAASWTPTSTQTAVPNATPTNTLRPANTATHTLVPTQTPVPTNTLVPTPTRTNTPVPTSTPRPTFTPTETVPVCPPPDSRMGYVRDHEPGDGDTNVSVGTTIEIEFNQEFTQRELEGALRVNGPGRVRYDIDFDVERGRSVMEIEITNMQYGSEYSIIIKRFLENACGVRQGVDVEFEFRTEDP